MVADAKIAVPAAHAEAAAAAAAARATEVGAEPRRTERRSMLSAAASPLERRGTIVSYRMPGPSGRRRRTRRRPRPPCCCSREAAAMTAPPAMRRAAVLLLLLLLMADATSSSAAAADAADVLAPRAYDPVPLGATVPAGWLRSQLDAQDAGLCGNRFLGGGGHATDSKWVGGRGYNGLDESYVYWLNGYLPMAVQ
eukprot:SAG31_NODE_658_length_13104_cov_4.409919_21_plen_195_part_01